MCGRNKIRALQEDPRAIADEVIQALKAGRLSPADGFALATVIAVAAGRVGVAELAPGPRTCSLG